MSYQPQSIFDTELELHEYEPQSVYDTVLDLDESVATIDPVASSVNASSPHDADGESASTVTVVLVDTNSDPVTGLSNADFSVNVTGSGTAGTVTETATEGTYTFEVTNVVAETVTVTVTAEGIELNDNPQIVFEAVLNVVNVSPENEAEGVSRTPTLLFNETGEVPENRYYQINIVAIATAGTTPDFDQAIKTTQIYVPNVDNQEFTLSEQLASDQWYAWKIVAKLMPEQAEYVQTFDGNDNDPLPEEWESEVLL